MQNDKVGKKFQGCKVCWVNSILGDVGTSHPYYGKKYIPLVRSGILGLLGLLCCSCLLVFWLVDTRIIQSSKVVHGHTASLVARLMSFVSFMYCGSFDLDDTRMIQNVEYGTQPNWKTFYDFGSFEPFTSFGRFGYDKQMIQQL